MIIYLQSDMSDITQLHVKLCLLENNGVNSLFLSKNLFFCLWFQKEIFLQILC